MIRIEVKTTEVTARSGNRKDGSGTWTIRTQPAWAHTFDANGKPQPYPTMISLQLEDNQAPHPIGNYELSPSSIYVGDFGRLMMGRPVLTMIQAAKAVA